jgi:D-alanyl-D-alanine dipeptidase
MVRRVTTAPHAPLLTPRVMPSFLHLTRDPQAEVVPSPRGRAPIPHLVEPDLMPHSPAAEHGDLVRVTAPRVTDAAAYHWAGLPDAVRHSHTRPEVADRVASAARRLPDGFGLAIFDAWRPLSVQQILFEAAYADPALPPGFVTPPSLDPNLVPPHNTGGTVDVTLTWRGKPLALGTPFDDFTDRAHTRALEGTLDPSRNLRRVLYWTMRSVGFVVIHNEWWHYEYGTRRWAAITGQPVRYGATSLAETDQATTSLDAVG